LLPNGSDVFRTFPVIGMFEQIGPKLLFLCL
jgi:hypothetical protein